VTTIHVTTSSQLAPDVVLAAGHDFSARRADVFPAVSIDRLEPGSADVTEGTPAGIGVNWERCRYDWTAPDVVIATVLDSNVYEPGSSRWELRVAPRDGGSQIEMIWVRAFRTGARGRIFGTLFGLFGTRIFTRYANQVVQNLESLATSGR
jgi:hypothetical protein